MISQIRLMKTIWLINAAAAFTAALIGILNPSIYDGLVAERIMPGVFTQDLLVIAGSIILFIIAIAVKQYHHRLLISAIGIEGFFFYAYGIYAIEQVYTPLYPLYLLLLGISLFGIIYTLSKVDYEKTAAIELPVVLRYITAGYAIFVAIMFTVIWTGQLIPLIRNGNRIEYTFSVYIIDLAFIMPAMAVSGIMSLRKRPLGTIAVPALFILGAGILSPLALAELIKPERYGQPKDTGELWLYLVLSLVFLLLAGINLAFLKKPAEM